MFLCSFAYGQNLLDTSTWALGSGSVSGFSQNGSTSENIRELGLNHVGESVVLWKAVPDASSNADGGWNSSYVIIDNTKKYRLSVWIKKRNSNDGTTYFGCRSHNGAYQTYRLDGTLDTNPYFFYGDLPKLDRWYLLIGYVHEKTSSETTTQGAIYDGVTGEFVKSTLRDFKFGASASNLLHRAYLYYDTNANDRQYFYAPRMEVVDGTEWSLEKLLSLNPDSKVYFTYDNAGNQNQRFYCDVAGCTVSSTSTSANKEVITEDISASINEENDLEDTYDNVENYISLSPNPTKGKVVLKLTSKSNVSISHSIYIYNISGILVKTIRSNSQNEMEMDVSNLATGKYLVHIHLSNGSSVTKQIIKI